LALERTKRGISELSRSGVTRLARRLGVSCSGEDSRVGLWLNSLSGAEAVDLLRDGLRSLAAALILEAGLVLQTRSTSGCLLAMSSINS